MSDIFNYSEKGDSSLDPPPPFPGTSSSPILNTPAASKSTVAKLIPTFHGGFACVSLNMYDRIRFIGFNAEDMIAIRPIVKDAWPKGIHTEKAYGGAEELMLHGTPWGSSWGENDEAKNLIRRLMECLFSRGWVLQASVDVSQKSNKDSLVFRYQPLPPPPCDWLSVSFDRMDRLRILDAPPPDLAAAVVTALQPAISSHNMSAERFEVKFCGTPWSPSGEQTVTLRVILLRLLEVMESFGFTLYAGVNQCSSTGDVLVMRRQKGWEQGVRDLLR